MMVAGQRRVNIGYWTWSVVDFVSIYADQSSILSGSSNSLALELVLYIARIWVSCRPPPDYGSEEQKEGNWKKEKQSGTYLLDSGRRESRCTVWYVRGTMT